MYLRLRDVRIGLLINCHIPQLVEGVCLSRCQQVPRSMPLRPSASQRTLRLILHGT